MRKFITVVVAVMLPALAARAGQPLPQPLPHKSDRAAASGKLLPLKGATSANSCAAYGAGFVRVEGSDTCVKIGGAISVGASARAH